MSLDDADRPRPVTRRGVVGALSLAGWTLAGCLGAGDDGAAGGQTGRVATDDSADAGVSTSRYGGPERDEFVAVTETGGRHLAVGTRTLPERGPSGWAISFDDPGRARWARTYRSPEHREEAAGEIDDGLVRDRFATAVPARRGALFVGATYVDGPASAFAWAVRVDDAGEVRWERRYRNEGANSFRDTLADARRTADGGVLLAGRTLGGHADDRTTGEGWILRADADGRPVWSRTYTPVGEPRDDYRDDPGHDAFTAVAPANGGSLLAGRATPRDAERPRGWLVRVDAGGGPRWRRTVDPGGGRSGLADVARTDGGHLAVGTAETTGGATTGWALAVDRGGDVRWERRLAGALGGVVAAEGAVVVAGERDGTGWAAALGSDGAVLGEFTAGVGASRLVDVTPWTDGYLLAGRAANATGGTDGLLVWVPHERLAAG